MNQDDNQDRKQVRSLVTEKDIDPDFGLFTEEVHKGVVLYATEQLKKQHPGNDAQSTEADWAKW